MNRRIQELFNISYPIIQGGMIWNASWKLAAAVSNAGGLGLIGAGSMTPDILLYHIRKCREHTPHPFGVNVPLLYKDIDKTMQIIIDEEVKIVFTSAGNPNTWTNFLKGHGVRVAHVVSSRKFAVKSQEAGVDAVVAEGFEAGGHNGIEETTTMCLIPLVKKAVSLPLIAAGGIGSGDAMLAAMALGADGVQIGSRFAASAESSGHIKFKQKIVEAGEGATKLSLKKLIPVRILKNKFYQEIQAAEDQGATVEELRQILGKSRAKKGMFDGELEEGELEIGQVSSLIDDMPPVSEIMKKLINEFNASNSRLSLIKLYGL